MPYGLRPVGFGNMAGYNTGGFVEYPITASTGNIFAGDFVELETAGTVVRQNTTTGESPIIANPTLGVAIGFRYLLNGVPTWGQYYPTAATNGFAMVCVDPEQVYLVQGDELMDQSDIGATFLVAGFAASAGSTVTGNSGIYLDSSTQNTTAQTLRCIGIPKDGSNEYSTTPNVLVKLLWDVTQFADTVGI